MNLKDRLTAEATKEFNADLAAGERKEGERAQFIADWVHDGMAEAQYDAACDAEAFGTHEDTPSLQSADLWGTGEGKYHGII